MARRGENIYKRKDGRWEGRYIKQYDINHKAKYGYVYAYTYNEVKHKLLDAKLKPSTNQCVNNSDTISYFSKMWLEEVRLQLKQSTYVKYLNIINNHINPNLGLIRVVDIDITDIKKIIDEKLERGRVDGNGGLSAKSVRDILSVLRLILKYAEISGIKCHCNFDAISIKQTNRCSTTFSMDEQLQLISFLLNDMDFTKLGILICVFTGMRIGEICALKFEDISLHEQVVHVTKTMQRIQNLTPDVETKTNIIITSPKSECSQRIIPLPDFMVRIIEKMHVSQKAYVLTGKPECFIEPRTLQNKFKAYLNECGLKKITFHQLRHRFATCCVELGFEIKSLSEILGHSSVNITLNRYVHSSLELKKQNINKLQQFFIQSPSELSS